MAKMIENPTAPKPTSGAVGAPFVDSARRALMRRVKTKGSAPEMAVRRALHALGYRYRLHDPTLPGRPDLVFRSRKLVVFVHGCFWHRHEGCRKATIPTTRREFWREKLEGNSARDARQAVALKEAGWAVHTVWECETRTAGFLVGLCNALEARVPSAEQKAAGAATCEIRNRRLANAPATRGEPRGK